MQLAAALWVGQETWKAFHRFSWLVEWITAHCRCSCDGTNMLHAVLLLRCPCGVLWTSTLLIGHLHQVHSFDKWTSFCLLENICSALICNCKLVGKTRKWAKLSTDSFSSRYANNGLSLANLAKKMGYWVQWLFILLLLQHTYLFSVCIQLGQYSTDCTYGSSIEQNGNRTDISISWGRKREVRLKSHSPARLSSLSECLCNASLLSLLIFFSMQLLARETHSLFRKMFTLLPRDHLQANWHSICMSSLFFICLQEATDERR